MVLYCVVPAFIWHKQMVWNTARDIVIGIISPEASRKALTLFGLVYSAKHGGRGYIKYMIKKDNTMLERLIWD